MSSLLSCTCGRAPGELELVEPHECFVVRCPDRGECMSRIVLRTTRRGARIVWNRMIRELSVAQTGRANRGAA